MKKTNNNHKKLIAMLLILLALFTTNIPVVSAYSTDVITCKAYPLFSMRNTYLFVSDVIQLSSRYRIKYWSSSNPKVATVTSTGKVRANSGGTATITAQDYYGNKYKTDITVMYYMNSHIGLNKNNAVTGYFKSNITGRKFNLYNQMQNSGWSGDCNRGVISSILSGYDARQIGKDDMHIVNHIKKQPDGLLYDNKVTNDCLDMFGLRAYIIHTKQYIPKGKNSYYSYFSYINNHNYIRDNIKAGNFVCLHIMR